MAQNAWVIRFTLCGPSWLTAIYSAIVNVPIVWAFWCRNRAQKRTAKIMAGAKKKLPNNSITPYLYATPGDPINPQPENAVATIVEAPTKGPKQLAANKKPPSPLLLCITLLL